MDGAESLQTAIASGFLFLDATFSFFILAGRHLPEDKNARLAEAREQTEEV